MFFRGQKCNHWYYKTFFLNSETKIFLFHINTEYSPTYILNVTSSTSSLWQMHLHALSVIAWGKLILFYITMSWARLFYSKMCVSLMWKIIWLANASGFYRTNKKQALKIERCPLGRPERRNCWSSAMGLCTASTFCPSVISLHLLCGYLYVRWLSFYLPFFVCPFSLSRPSLWICGSPWWYFYRVNCR